MVGYGRRNCRRQSGRDPPRGAQNLDEAVELTVEAREELSDAPEPDAPWFDS